MNGKGFTLIELLIVIALLGALAIGLLAALDPFEQLKKGKDTGVRNTTAELQGAVVRYFAITGGMPWAPSTTVGPVDAQGGYSTIGIDKIVSSGELKPDFSTLAGSATLTEIRVIGTTESTTTCFRPLSKSFRSDPNVKYDASGVEGASCPDKSSPSFSCYWCIK